MRFLGKSWFEPDVQFTTELGISDCQSRLEAEGVSIWKGKSLISRRETGELGFLWYKKQPSLLSTVLQGPALMGRVAACKQGCQVQVNFRPYVSPRDSLLITIPIATFFLIRDIIPGRTSFKLFILVVVLLVLIVLLQWIFLLFMRPHWEQLTKNLHQVIPPFAHDRTSSSTTRIQQHRRRHPR